jgi:hypothetical protein
VKNFAGVEVGGGPSVSLTLGDLPMSELENKLNHILEEHQHESGLHMIGGRRRLIDRLVKFFEEDLKTQAKSAPAASREN